MSGPVYAGQYGPEGLELPDGRPARSKPVTIRNPDGSLATLYSNKLKTAIVANPLLTDDLGNLKFFAVPGEYNIDVFGLLLPVLVQLHPDDPGFGLEAPVLSFEHYQDTPTITLTLHHDLGFDPAAVDVVHADGARIYPKRTYLAAGISIKLDFSRDFRGTVKLS